MFMEVVAKTRGAVRAFDAYRLPWTCRFAEPVEVLIPTKPVELYRDWVFRIDEIFSVVTTALAAVTAFDAYRLPAIERDASVAFVPIPTVPFVPERVETLRVVIFARVAKMFPVERAFET